MKWFSYLIVGTLVCFYYFPFSLTSLPTVNTKMVLAALGLVLLIFSMARKRSFTLSKSILVLLLLSGFVSLIALFSITYNQTPDNTYVSYVVSAAVWLSASYALCHIIYVAHRKINVLIILNYLVCACLFQCIAAIVIHFNPSIQSFVDKNIVGCAFIHNLERLYGIGAALDVAGTRFSCVLVGISFVISRKTDEVSTAWMYFLFVAFAIITVLGNLIARTTVVGAILGIAIMIVLGILLPSSSSGKNATKLFRVMVIGLGIAIPTVVFYNNINREFHDLFEFGFEGFYSLVETGEWQVDSNEILKDMVVWPDNMKTWIIGDGYFVNQRNDINYIGDATTEGYYMGTDIGYLRFIFYFGIIGLIAIMSVITYAAISCMNHFKEYALMFFFVLVSGLIMWAKSSTDIFLFFCPFLCASALLEEIDFLGYSDNNSEEKEDDVELFTSSISAS